jgi:hypothetical protein
MACPLPTLLVLLAALSASLALLARGPGAACEPNRPRRPGSR